MIIVVTISSIIKDGFGEIVIGTGALLLLYGLTKRSLIMKDKSNLFKTLFNKTGVFPKAKSYTVQYKDKEILERPTTGHHWTLSMQIKYRSIRNIIIIVPCSKLKQKNY
jgi:hypothetical protein